MSRDLCGFCRAAQLLLSAPQRVKIQSSPGDSTRILIDGETIGYTLGRPVPASEAELRWLHGNCVDKECECRYVRS